MKCADYKRMFYLYDELTDTEKLKVQRHIASCAACQRLFHHVQQERHVFKTIAPSYRATGTDPALTMRIMHAVSSKKSLKLSVTGKLLEFLQYRPVRYALSVLALSLICFFLVEFHRAPDIREAHAIYPGRPDSRTVKLNSTLFREKIKRTLESGGNSGDENTPSLLECIRACKTSMLTDCASCRKKYSKNYTL